jgi:hypothetical protein
MKQELLEEEAAKANALRRLPLYSSLFVLKIHQSAFLPS